MIFYAIRHKITGFYMPTGERRHTKEEPKKDCVPRLFKRKSDAVNALNWWLAGIRYQASYNDDESLYIVKTPHRNVEEMEVVQILLMNVDDVKDKMESEFDPLYVWRVNNAAVEAHRI